MAEPNSGNSVGPASRRSAQPAQTSPGPARRRSYWGSVRAVFCRTNSPTRSTLRQAVPHGSEKRRAWRRWRTSRTRHLLAWLAVALALVCAWSPATAQDSSRAPPTPKLLDGLTDGPEKWTSPAGLSSTLQVMLLLTVLSLAPAVVLMTTCFVRIIVVLGLLRQAIGTQQLPPSQVITSLALFMTLLVMTPVWKQVYDRAIVPYTEKQITLEEAWTEGAAPIRRFMILQIEYTRNSDDIYLFLNYLPDQPKPSSYEEVPLAALLPAFMLSELKTAFLIGFQVYLPFLIVDMVVASVLISMGMLMVPPALIALPFKLMLFVLLDGWHLVVGMLMESFQRFT